MSGREALLYATDPAAAERLAAAKVPMGGRVDDVISFLANPFGGLLDMGKSYYNYEIKPKRDAARESRRSDEIVNERMKNHPHNPGK